MKQLRDNVTVVFASNNQPASIIIKLFTLSHWSHVAILDDEGYIYDATLLSGVRRIHFDEWKTHYKELDFTIFPVKDRTKVFEWLQTQVGKKYDALGILSFILRKNYEDKDKWFCSELVAHALGIKYKPWRLSPQFLSQFYKTLKGYIL
jgi:uncharacterized protein YycO